MKNILILIAILIFSTPLWSQSDLTGVYDPDIARLLNLVSQDSIKMHIENLADAGGYQSRVSFTAGNEWAANYIANTLARYLGNERVQFEPFYVFGATAPYDTIQLVNVIGTIKGSIDSTVYFVIGGHFDTTANRDKTLVWEIDWMNAKAPGADDNASGVAAMLEIARVLADPANNFTPPATIKFIAFGAEESHPVYGNGHQGSGKFVLHAFQKKDYIAGTFILDMFGFNDTGNNYFNIVSNTNSVELGQVMLEARDIYQIGINSNAEPFPYATYSDHDRFWAYNYKAILLIENAPPWENNLPWYNLNPFYHYQSDTPEKVNYQQVTKITRLTLAALVTMVDQVTAIQPIAEGFSRNRDFGLLKNYPNPFNATTTIEYRVDQAGRVVLEIYDIQGRMVSTLVNQSMPPGTYTHRWLASDQNGFLTPTGIYFVTLRLNDQISSKKIMLMK